jgi:integrase
MKAEKEHRVPLTKQTIALLESIHFQAQPNDLIFPSLRTGVILSDM